MPKGRSGHSLTFIGNSNYVLYGGIEDTGNGQILPNGEVWIMNAGRGKSLSGWHRECFFKISVEW